jgi:plastocyanin
MGGAGGGGGGGMPLINGCDQATAENHLADAKVTISVGANGFTFSPACVRMKKGAQINFVGAFASHPLVGGVIGPPPVPDSSSPIKPTNSGNSATFTIPLAGTYPFYCEYHQPTMAGAAFVE